MDFLTLVQRTWLKCGLTGAGPVAVTGQTSINARIVRYVQDAYTYVQQQHQRWKFHWSRTSTTLTTGVATYAPGDFAITDFRLMDRVLLSVDGNWQPLVIKDEPGDIARFDNLSSGRPTCFFVLPDGTWTFDAEPDDDYPVRFEYYRDVHELAANADAPLLPAEHHGVIIHKAVEYYAHYDEDTSLLEEARRGYASAEHRLERAQLDQLVFAKSDFL